MEIKFRGKSTSKEYWCCGYLIVENDGNSYIHWTDEYGNKKAEKVHTESVGQLWNPSLRIELYTGDLFTAICSPSGSNVKKERLCKAGFSGNGLQVSVWYKKEWWLYQSMDYTSIKVIGNTTDNPDLLGW